MRVGKFKQPFNLEEQTSSNNIDFMERSYVNQTAPAKKLGTMIFGELTPGVTYAGSAFQMNDTENDISSEDMSYAGRTAVNFAELVGNKEAILHVGLAGYNNSWSVRPTSSSGSGGASTSGTLLSYRTPGRGLNNIFRAQIQGTNMSVAMQNGASDNTASVDSKAYGLEAIAAFKSIKLQGEYTQGDYKASYLDTASVSLDNKAYYGEVMWLLSGENYSSAYKKGTFSSIKPNKNFDLENFSGLGAWELGLRYEAYEVTNGNSVAMGTTTVAPVTNQNATRWQGNMNCNGASGSAFTSTQSNCSSGAHTVTAGIKWIINPNSV